MIDFWLAADRWCRLDANLKTEEIINIYILKRIRKEPQKQEDQMSLQKVLIQSSVLNQEKVILKSDEQHKVWIKLCELLWPTLLKKWFRFRWGNYTDGKVSMYVIIQPLNVCFGCNLKLQPLQEVPENIVTQWMRKNYWGTATLFKCSFKSEPATTCSIVSLK